MLPSSAAWRHIGARDGFEVVHFMLDDRGCTARGATTAVEEGVAWVVSYEIVVDARWHTRRASVEGRTEGGSRSVLLEHDGAGRWLVDGAHVVQLDGCLDVDLESSVLTNAFPVQRLALAIGASADAPAAYVRAVGTGVDRLEQTYRRVEEHSYGYTAPAFDFAAVVRYAADGLVVDYPGLAERVT